MAKFIFQAGVFFKRPLYPANTSTIVTVYDAETGSIAPIWNDRAGADPRANPGAIWQEGQIKFYIDPGRYNIVASNGSDSKTWNDVIIVDPDSGGGGGGGTWGSITGTLSAQTDLQAALDAKQSARNTVTALTSASGVVTVDYSLGDYFTLALSENVTSWIINNLPGAGKGATVAIHVTQDSTPRTVALPIGADLKGGNTDAVPTGSGDVALLFLTTFNNGASWAATWAEDFA